jgi:hypothetical protein
MNICRVKGQHDVSDLREIDFNSLLWLPRARYESVDMGKQESNTAERSEKHDVETMGRMNGETFAA